MAFVIPTGVEALLFVGPIVDATTDEPKTDLAHDATGMAFALGRTNFDGTSGLDVITLTDAFASSPAYRWAHVGLGIYLLRIAATGAAWLSNDTPGTFWCMGTATGVRPFREFAALECKPPALIAALYEGDELLEVDCDHAGSGARQVIINVKDADTSANLQNVLFRATLNGISQARVPTDASGNATVNLDDATYTIALTAGGYQYVGASTIAVSGNATVPLTMEALPSSGGPPGTVDGRLTVYDNTGDVEAGVTIYCWMARKPTGGYGSAFDREPQEEVSDVNGIVTFEGLVIGATYAVRRGLSGPITMVTIPDDASDPYLLDDVIGEE